MQEAAQPATKSWPNWKRSTMTRTTLASISSRSTTSDWPSSTASRTSRPSRISVRRSRSSTKVRLLAREFYLANRSFPIRNRANFCSARKLLNTTPLNIYNGQKQIVMIPNGWKYARLLLEFGRNLGNLARYEKQVSRLGAVYLTQNSWNTIASVCGFSWFSFFLSAVEAALHSRTMAAYPFICTPLLDPNRSLSDYFWHEPAVVEQQTGGNIKKFCETNTLVRILVDYKNDPKCANTVAGLGSPLRYS